MQNEQETRTNEDLQSSQELPAGQAGLPGDDSGSASVQMRRTESTAAEPSEARGAQDILQEEFEDGLDYTTGARASGAYHRAVADYDPDETNMQIAEHWHYDAAKNPVLAKNGRF